MYPKTYLLLPFLFLTLAGTGCAAGSTLSHETGMHSDASADSHAGHVMTEDQTTSGAVTLANNRVALDNKEGLKTGHVRLAFKLFGRNGDELETKDLKITHDKRMHLFLVRDDMTQFQHLHPEYTDGTWVAESTIPEQGDYQMYVDIAPEKEAASVLRIPLRISGAIPLKNFPAPSGDLSALNQEVKTTLSVHGTLKTGEAKQLTFFLTKNGQPVNNIDPYLGAFGHVVLHVHPLTETTPTDGKVIFETTFMTNGRYTLYAQFNVEGSVKTFPITIDVEDSEITQLQGMDHSAHH
jgi:hypothetical protein